MEQVDVYTASREKTGKILSRESVFRELADDERILLVHTCIFRPDHRMLIQQRQKTKDYYPGCWDVSAGGFVFAGEDSLNAAIRETEEELGLNLQSGRFVDYSEELIAKLFDAAEARVTAQERNSN